MTKPKTSGIVGAQGLSTGDALAGVTFVGGGGVTFVAGNVTCTVTYVTGTSTITLAVIR